MKKKIFLPMMAAALLFGGLVACQPASSSANKSVSSSSSIPAKPKITVSAAGDKKTLEIDEEVQLSANEQGVSWKSGDEKIATVDQTGKVKAIASGEVTITASKDGFQNGSITITVNKPAALATLKMEDADHFAADGWWGTDAAGYSPIYARSSGNASDGQCIAHMDNGDKETLTFTSDKAVKAEIVVMMASRNAVDDLGEVMDVKFNDAAISLAGKAFEGGSSSEFAEVSLGQQNLKVGDNVLLFEFKASAPYMDDVMLYSKETATVAIKAAPAKETITITNTELSVVEGATLQLTGAPAGASYVSSNEANATVNESGLVTGVKKGSANITVTKAGMISARVAITVTEKIVAGEIRAEAENGTVGGKAITEAGDEQTDVVKRGTSTGETCTAQWKAGAELTIKFNAANAGSYKLALVGRAGGQYGMGDIEDLSAVISLKLNNAAVTVPAIAVTGRTFTAYEIGNVNLQAGENTIVVKALGEEDDKAPNIDFFKLTPNA